MGRVIYEGKYDGYDYCVTVELPPGEDMEREAELVQAVLVDVLTTVIRKAAEHRMMGLLS